ncbi:hypothetical protein JTB14_017851 [Gonioctena quinquepunctata]|nr:hypothetical protein JTB14_017851 [Gonioctena quinquepunctata]
MTASEKALFLLKIRRLNEDRNGRTKRETSSSNHTDLSADKRRKKRSIVIDSEIQLPLYQVRLEDSNEAPKKDDYKYGDEDYDESRDEIIDEVIRTLHEQDEDDYYEPRSKIVADMRRIDDDSREQIFRKAIREELKKFKQVESSEEKVGLPFQYNNMNPQSPLLHLLSLPVKFFKGVKELNKQAAPFVGSVPKVIVGTKKYFRDFGRNFKKNVLNFASDVIGDFDHMGPSDNILDKILNQKRYKRNIGDPKNESKLEMKQYEPEYSVDFNSDVTSPNFRDASENKVRKKRYIMKMVDDDEVEAILRRKLERMLDDSEESNKPQKRRIRMRKYSDYDDSEEILQSKRYRGKKKHNRSEENFKHKIVVEKVRPKVIIDNNGLPFMELNGYKRPIFMKNKRFYERNELQSSEEKTHTNYDSSEEANLQKIHGVIDHAKNSRVQSIGDSEMPIQTLKEKISQLLHQTDVLVHLDFEKYDEIYEDLINVQHIKTSTIQDWKRLVMEKRINNRDAKIALLEKFHRMQHFKEKAVTNIVYALYLDSDNTFVVTEFTKMLVKLQKLQCIVNQVVGSFHNKFSMGAKFEMEKEIKFVDFLSSTNFVKAKTRNDVIAKLREDRDCQLQENIQELEKLQRLLVENDEEVIGEVANILWEIKNIDKMQKANIEEMYHKMEEQCKIKKNLKILFDFSKRQQALAAEEKELLSKCESQESDEEVEVSIEDEKSIKIETTPKKIDIDEFKKKWKDKIQKHIFLVEKNLKKTLLKLKIRKGSDESDEHD